MQRDKTDIEARWLIRRMAEEFHGLVDGESDVSGADLVEWLSYQIGELDYVRRDMQEARDSLS